MQFCSPLILELVAVVTNRVFFQTCFFLVGTRNKNNQLLRCRQVYIIRVRSDSNDKTTLIFV